MKASKVGLLIFWHRFAEVKVRNKFRLGIVLLVLHLVRLGLGFVLLRLDLGMRLGLGIVLLRLHLGISGGNQVVCQI